MLKIYQNFLEVLFYNGLKFQGNQILITPCNKIQKLLYKNYISFLVFMFLNHNVLRISFLIRFLVHRASRPTYKSNLEETRELQEKVEELMKKGHIRGSMSSCAIWVFLVYKKERMRRGGYVLIIKPSIILS